MTEITITKKPFSKKCSRLVSTIDFFSLYKAATVYKHLGDHITSEQLSVMFGFKLAIILIVYIPLEQNTKILI